MSESNRRNRFDIIILARIAGSGAKSAIGPAELQRSLHRYIGHDLTKSACRQIIDDRTSDLVERDLLTVRPLTVTETGRVWLCEQLGVDKPPSWRDASNRLLPMLGLGLTPGSADARHRFASTENVQAAFLADAYRLPLSRPTLASVVNAMIATKLETTRPVRSGRDLRPLLTEYWVSDGTWRPDARDGSRQLASPVSSNGPVASPPAPAPTLDDFATAVRGVAAGRDVTRFGDRKVYISSLFDQLGAVDPRFAHLSLDEFKSLLVKANQQRLLTLARADLVSAMDPAEVDASHIQDLNSDFHFVLDQA